MDSKERMLAALRGRPVDKLPVAPIYLHLYLAQEIRLRALAGYQALIGDRQEVSLEAAQEARIQTRAIREAWSSLGETPDWIWTPLLAPAEWLAECVLLRQDDQLWRIHCPSGEREELSASVVETDSTADHWEQPLPRTHAEVDAMIPVPTAEKLLSNRSLVVARRLVEEMGGEIFVPGKMGSAFWRCYSLLGFQGLMTMPYDNPKLLHYMLQRQTAALLALVRAYAKVGVHGVFIEECLTSADLISPRIYDEFVFPYDQALLAEFRALSLPTIFYVCGDVVPRLPRLVKLAPTALAVEESKKGFRIDLAEVAAAVGDRMALFGNLDATGIKDWGDAELAYQIEGQLKAARPSRGFIVSMGSPFPLETPRQRVADFIAAARATARQVPLEDHSG